MKKNILIADKCDIIRRGLEDIFREDRRVSQVYKVATSLDLIATMQSCSLDLVIVNQSLIRDMSMLPLSNIVILANKLDIDLLLSAYKYGVRAYLSENVSVEMLYLTLDLTEGALLIDPTLIHTLFTVAGEQPYKNRSFMPINQHLTPHKREIIISRKERLSYAKKQRKRAKTLEEWTNKNYWHLGGYGTSGNC